MSWLDENEATVEPVEAGKHDEEGGRIADLTEKKALIAPFWAGGMTQRTFARQERGLVHVRDLAEQQG